MIKSSGLCRSKVLLLSAGTRTSPDDNPRGAEREKVVFRKWFKGAEEVGIRFQMNEAPPRPGDASGVPIFHGKEFNLNNLKEPFEVTVTFEENGGERFVFDVSEVRAEHDSDRVSLPYALA